MNLPIYAEVITSKRDVIRFHRFHSRWRDIISPLLTTLVFCIFIIIEIGIEASIIIWPIIFIFYLISVVLTLIIRRWKAVKNYKNVFKNLGIIKYSFDQHKIETEGHGSKGIYEWKLLHRIKSDRNNLYNNSKKNIAFTLPKRYLTKEETNWILSVNNKN